MGSTHERLQCVIRKTAQNRISRRTTAHSSKITKKRIRGILVLAFSLALIGLVYAPADNAYASFYNSASADWSTSWRYGSDKVGTMFSWDHTTRTFTLIAYTNPSGYAYDTLKPGWQNEVFGTDYRLSDRWTPEEGPHVAKLVIQGNIKLPKDCTTLFAGATYMSPIASWSYNTAGIVHKDIPGVGTQYEFINGSQGPLADAEFIGFENLDTSQVTSMSRMFWGAKNANPDVSTWDISNVEDMSMMFAFSGANPDISSWDLPEKAGAIFMGATNYDAYCFPQAFYKPCKNVSRVRKIANTFYWNDKWDHYYDTGVVYGDFSLDRNRVLTNLKLKTLTTPLGNLITGETRNKLLKNYIFPEGDAPEEWDIGNKSFFDVMNFSLISHDKNYSWSLYTSEGMIPGSLYKPRIRQNQIKFGEGNPYYYDNFREIVNKLAEEGMSIDTLITIGPGHHLYADTIKVLQGMPTEYESNNDFIDKVSDEVDHTANFYEYYGKRTGIFYTKDCFNYPECSVDNLEAFKTIDTSKPGPVDERYCPKVTMVFNDEVPHLDDQGKMVKAPLGTPAFALKDSIAIPVEVVPNTPIQVSINDTNGFTAGAVDLTTTVSLEKKSSGAGLISGDVCSWSTGEVRRSFNRLSQVTFEKDEYIQIKTLHVSDDQSTIEGAISATPDNLKDYILHTSIQTSLEDSNKITQELSLKYEASDASNDGAHLMEQLSPTAFASGVPIDLAFSIPENTEAMHVQVQLTKPLVELTGVEEGASTSNPWAFAGPAVAGALLLQAGLLYMIRRTHRG